jgi:hypothetical protein
MLDLPPTRVTVICDLCERLIEVRENKEKVRTSRVWGTCPSCENLPDGDDLYEDEE